MKLGRGWGCGGIGEWGRQGKANCFKFDRKIGGVAWGGGWTGGAGVRGERGREAGGEGEGSGERGGGKRGERGREAGREGEGRGEREWEGSKERGGGKRG